MQIMFSNGRRRVSGPAIFLDRDGVINRRRADDYVLEWSQFAFMPGIREALRELSMLRLPMIVISNQSAVGRGLLKPTVLKQITSQFRLTLLEQGSSLAAVYYCTHQPDDNCSCRKPKPALLNKAAADFAIDLSRSIFIGDADTDVQAAQAAGCHPVLFGPGLSSSSGSLDWVADLPVARTAKELFQVAVDSLRAANRLSEAVTPLRIQGMPQALIKPLRHPMS